MLELLFLFLFTLHSLGLKFHETLKILKKPHANHLHFLWSEQQSFRNDCVSVSMSGLRFDFRSYSVCFPVESICFSYFFFWYFCLSVHLSLCCVCVFLVWWKWLEYCVFWYHAHFVCSTSFFFLLLFYYLIVFYNFNFFYSVFVLISNFIFYIHILLCLLCLSFDTHSYWG